MIIRPLARLLISGDENPWKTTLARAANPSLDFPGAVLTTRTSQQQRLEIECPVNTLPPADLACSMVDSALRSGAKGHWFEHNYPRHTNVPPHSLV